MPEHPGNTEIMPTRLSLIPCNIDGNKLETKNQKQKPRFNKNTSFHTAVGTMILAKTEST